MGKPKTMNVQDTETLAAEREEIYAASEQKPVPPIQLTTESVWILLRRVNGHFEPLSPSIESFPTEEAAIAARAAKAVRQHGTTYAVLQLVSQETYIPVSVVKKVELE
jgi:hypothetical protein